MAMPNFHMYPLSCMPGYSKGDVDSGTGVEEEEGESGLATPWTHVGSEGTTGADKAPMLPLLTTQPIACWPRPDRTRAIIIREMPIMARMTITPVVNGGREEQEHLRNGWTGEPKESGANTANGTPITGGASEPRKWASQGDGHSQKKKRTGPKHPMSAEFIDKPSDDDGPATDTFENPGGASSVGGQSSGTTWGGAGSSIDGVVNDQFSGNASSGVINGPMDWAGGYGQNQQEYNPHNDPLMASLFVRYPDLNLGLCQGFDDGFPL
ncbi:hypothetical protein BS47DRAFT_1358708 [Hydnum rufescens UP504]|uniref:Uncharacterized protein n=1 Tax=Hydnum rufescens UP504 TaxID=1448309 RepID=A0A9P6E143_9AGAM|nr:hypothetical protein BS47DRAFT_1358708 [Hydnum rufescens UP504]